MKLPMTPAEKALIEAVVKWEKQWATWHKEGCDCHNCKLIRAVRRVVKERRRK